MNAITSLVALLARLVPAISGSTSGIADVVSVITQITPTLIQEYNDVLPFVKNIITALKADPATTQAQLDQLSALDAQVDAAFDAAAADALAEDSKS